MKQLIQLIAVITLCVPQIHGQTTALIDSLDWSFQSPGATSGQTDDGNFWQATNSNQDGTGTFGVSNDVFVFEDMEGSGPCPCADGDPSCGSLDNELSIEPIFVFGYCEATVKFDITTRGDLRCGGADDQSPANFDINGCPSDAGSEWAGTDGLEISIFSSSTGETKTMTFCGANSEDGSFTFDRSFDIGQDGGTLTITITGGTQRDGASYDIGNISVRGLLRENLILNPQIEGSPTSREVCEGAGSISLIVAANPNHQYTWAFPDGTTVSGNVSNGRDKLRLNNISPATSGTYRVTVVDDNGCELYDDIDVTVLASIDAQCQGQVRFSQLNSVLCSDFVLPSMDDNGITGTWTPGVVLNDFAGQTLQFTFTPDDPAVASDDFLITVDDLAPFPNFGVVPEEIPLLCNAAGLTYDFIEMFNLNYVDYRLEVSGDLSLFNFVPSNAVAVVDEFVQEFRNIRVDGLSPRTVGFKVEAYTPCGAPPIAKSFFVTIVDPEDPITVDTTLCAGDSFMFGNHEIRGDTVIMGEHACDTMFIANITRLQSVTSTTFFPGSGLTCGDAYYYYDTIVAGRHVGWIRGQLMDPPPYGENYDTVFTESFSGLYTLPVPASNGCDSIQRISLSVSGQTVITELRFDLCANSDTIIMSGSTPFKIDKDNPEMFVTLGNCRFLDIKANLIEAIADTIPQSTHCKGDIVTLEVAPGDFRDFDDSMIYPNTIRLAQGANGCAATMTVDLIFEDLAQGTDTRRICPGESFQVGSVTFDAAVVDQEVIISGGAANGCDSTVVVNVTVVEPTIVPVTMTICPDETFTQEGEVFDANRPSGTAATLSSLGCDSILYDVQLTFYDVIDTIIAPSICPGDVIILSEYGYTIDENNLTADLEGTTADGCKQNVMIRATIGGATRTSFSETICFGESFLHDGIERVVTGAYEETHTSTSGCDSISTLNLTVLRSIPVTADGEIFACTGLPSVHAGKEYLISGRYRDTLSSVNGCDSIITFTITFTPPLTNDLGVITICPGETFTYENVDYNRGGIQEVMLSTPEGCDSMVTFNLQFHDILMTDIGEIEICPEVPFILLGNSYSDEGNFTAMAPDVNGCDSLITFSIKHSPPIVTEVVETICAGESIEVFGQDYTATTDEMILDASSGQGGCDSTVHLVLTVLEEIITSESHVICEGTSVTVGSRTFTAAVVDEPVVLTSQASCDSTVLVTVTISPNFNIDLGEIQLCGDDAFQVGDELLSDEGPHTVNLIAQTGCDSTVTLSINRIEEIRTDISEVLCFGTSAEVNNKIYDQTGIFFDTLTSSQLCDSILVIDISVLSKIDTNYLPIEPVCFGTSFNFNNDELSATGDYTYDFTTQEGCDSIVVVRVEVAEEIINVVSATTCDDTPYLFEGQSFSVSGRYPVKLEGAGAGGCDSTVTLELTVNNSFATVLGVVALCAGEGYQLGDTLLTSMGEHTILTQASTGCDSLITVTLAEISEVTTDISEVICFGSSTEVNNKTYDQAGIFFDTLTSGQMCDSILVIDITMLTEIADNMLPTETICFGESFIYNNETLSTEGEHRYTFQTAEGCDSTVVVTLAIAEEVTSLIQASTCDTYDLDGQSFSQTGQYEITFPGQSANGCDSTVILDLTVNETYDIDLGVREICRGSSITMGTYVLDNDEIYTLLFTSASGCDSIVTVAVTVVEELNEDLGSVTICEGDSYAFGGQNITESGSYTDTVTTDGNCINIRTLQVDVTPQMVINIQDLIGSCEGGANGSFVIGNLPDATPPFIVTGLDGISQISSLPFTVSGLAVGDYSFELTDANGCMTIGDAIITNERDNALTITSITVDPTGIYELILNYSGEIESIEWSDEEGLSCYDCPNPTVEITETTTFTVTVTDAEGCVSTAMITLEVDGVGMVYFPNVINPNSSVGNHRFYPQTEEGNDARYDVYIFDRWGNKVYEMRDGPVNDISFGWNGRYLNNRINSGVFVYSVRLYKSNGITKTYKGDITVVE